MENIKKKEFVKRLIEREYDSDPVKAWKLKNGLAKEDGKKAADSDEEEEEAPGEYDYDYLMDMKMRSMLREKAEELLKKSRDKKEELEKLRKTSPQSLWITDLDAFLEELDKVEQLEQEQNESGKPLKLTAKVGGKGGKGRVTKTGNETKPSAFAQRFELRIDPEYLKKSANEAGKKTGRGKKKETAKSKDSDDDTDKSLADRIGTSPQIVAEEKQGKAKGLKQTKLNFKTATQKSNGESKPTSPKKRSGTESKASPKKKAKKNPWSDSESSEDESDEPDFISDEEDFVPVKPRAPTTKRAAAASKPNYNLNLTDSGDLFANGQNGGDHGKVMESPEDLAVAFDSSVEMETAKKPAKRTSEELFDTIIMKPKNPMAKEVVHEVVSETSDDDSDDGPAVVEEPVKTKPKPLPPAPEPAKKAAKQSKPSEPKTKKSAPKKKKVEFNSDSDDEPKKKFTMSSDDEQSFSDRIKETKRSGRVKSRVTYNFDQSSDDDD